LSPFKPPSFSFSDSSGFDDLSGLCKPLWSVGLLLGYAEGAGLAKLENGPTNGESFRRPPGTLSSPDAAAVAVGVTVRRGELEYVGGGGPFIIAPTIILLDDDDGGGGGGDDGRSRSDRCSTGDRTGVGALPIFPSPPLPDPRPVPPVIIDGPVNMGVFVP
jgi:hypothetical protein